MEQRLVQSPQMIQAMQILQLPTQDLEERIDQELMENPFLERDGEESEENENPKTEAEPDADADGVANMLDELERYERDFGDRPRSRGGDPEEADRKFEAMRNTPDRHQSLAEDLLDQLAFLELTERERELTEYLIYSLDERGYLQEPLSELAALCPYEGATEEELESLLLLLRDATHPALGAHDLRECLLLQLESHGIEEPLVRTLILDHLPDITTNRLPRIAKATGHSVEEVKAGIESLRTLDPNPGGEYGGTPATVILPDVVVEEREGDYEVRLTRDRVPELRVSPSYRALLQQATRGDGVQAWVKKRLESARWFIDALQQRQATLLRIAEIIFRTQRAYLEEGVRALKPLRMQEVADEAGVHISTVSRAVSGKYAQTPRGIKALKFFFTSGTAKSSGEVTSQVSIKQRLRELVEQEDGEHPLSDDQIGKLLAEKDGIRIARRTVTKYRKALGIPSSSQRRQF